MTAGVRRATAAAATLPPALAIAAVLAIALTERAGWRLFADAVPANLAEAAAAGRADDVVRRLRLGEDRHRVYSLRPEATHSPLLRATPAEAAIWSRQPLMIELLDREGAIGEGDRSVLACLAADLDLPEIAGALAPDGTEACVPQRARERVLARASLPE